MSYHRGGKVWLDGRSSGWVALERDWTGDTLPQDLVSENGLVGVEFKLVDHLSRAAIAGYTKMDDQWLFFLSDQSIEFHDLDGLPVYLRGDFNNWELSPEYQLCRLPQGWGLLINQEFLNEFEECEFKFFSGDDRWIEPHSQFPAFPNKDHLLRNGWFNQKRTGRDLFSFRNIEPQNLSDCSKWINSRPTGDFGFSYDGKCSQFRIFAPRAELVELLIFDNPCQNSSRQFPMLFSEDGAWSLSHSEDLSGCLYNYRITQRDNRGELFSKEILDPYARATCGRNGPGIARNKKNFPRLRKYRPPAMEDAVVVEAHLRDLLTHASLNLSDSERMQFSGLSQWLKSDDCYLRKLGANVVELQPVHEFDARHKTEYHWGYMPVNFFSPASVYASQPVDGSVVEEFAQLVTSFHHAGLAVVLDVVYNHVGIPPHLIHLDKEIYCLTDGAGNLTNFSGCGNDLRCDSEPVKKLILDSLIYWVDAFDVDGFRFDLGELLGFELLAEIQSELNRIKPGILLFAEPWSFRGRLPTKMNQTKYALWSDACREGLLNFAKNKSNKNLVIELLSDGLDHQNKNPYQSVNYLESHDDYALVDRFRDLFNWDNDARIPDEVISRTMIALGLLMVAPGVPLISAGQDILRHKHGIRNTYLLGDVNAINYQLEKTYHLEAEFVRDLIKLRLSQPGARARESDSGGWKVCSFPTPEDSVILFGWESESLNERYLITANTSASEINIELPDSWRNNLNLLISYGGKTDGHTPVQPLSFCWFKSTT